MTAFNKDLFDKSGEYVTYGPDRKFVARFKHVRGNKASFLKFLIKNFSTEEYFDALKTESPIPILETKGYVSKHIVDWAKRGMIPNGYRHYTQDQLAVM